MTNSFSSSSSKDTVTPHCEQRLYSTVGNNCTTLSGMTALCGRGVGRIDDRKETHTDETQIFREMTGWKCQP